MESKLEMRWKSNLTFTRSLTYQCCTGEDDSSALRSPHRWRTVLVRACRQPRSEGVSSEDELPRERSADPLLQPKTDDSTSTPHSIIL